jgi:hypothetical protein
MNSRAVARGLAVAVAGALAGVISLLVAFVRHPEVVLEMDRDLSRITSGFYPVERHDQETFAWTSPRAVVALPGLDRRVDWTCSVRLRGGRPDGFALPTVELAIDGIRRSHRTATNTYEDMDVLAPANASRAGVTLAILSSQPFVPGPSDPRQLGVQVDRLVCRPTTGRMALPPGRALAGAAISAAALGAAFGVVGPSLSGALGGIAILAIVQAVPLAAAPAPYGPFAGRMAWISCWIAAALVLLAAVIERWRRMPLSAEASIVVAFAGAVLFVDLLAILHPSKQPIDVVFHAHRFEWVLSGRYFFTQPMPDGVQFPYAIALYLFAAPWASITRDYVTLLRIVVCTAHAIAGALLYPMVAKTWGTRLTGLAAVMLFHLVPLPYVVIGNANLTFAFGQSIAVAAMAAAVLWSLRLRDAGQLAGLFALSAVAFLSHVGTFSLLLAMLLTVGLAYRVLGGPALRPPAHTILLVTMAAAAFAVVSYYGRFGEVYRTLERVGAEPAAGAGLPLHVRMATALGLGLRAAGWPIVVLAAVGAWRVGAGRDRLRLALASYAVVYVGFLAFAVSAPVEPRFQRYTDEFIDRLNYATMPAVATLAACGGSWAWSAGTPGRIAATVLFLAAAAKGAKAWTAWLH